MSKNVTFVTLITALSMAGAYGVYSISQQQSPAKTDSLIQTEIQTVTQNEKVIKNVDARPETRQNQQASLTNEYQRALAEAVQLLENSQHSAAIELVDSLYQELSSEQLKNFENLFLTTSAQLWQSNKNSQAIALLSSYNDIFNSLDGWTLLSKFHLNTQDWQASINALLKAIALEYRSDKLETLMTNLTAAASSQRALLEGQKDELGINQLYKNLHQHHPTNARFQLELASSYLRLDDTNNARSLLEMLLYDIEYGDIAKTILAKLENNSVAVIKQPAADNSSKNDIVVPLLRSGNSFFANTFINNRQHRLLLDTGASITALSQNVIKSLKLTPTGRTIQLNTANGLTQARLYRADQIRLGKLTIKNLVVAEIDFEKNSQVHGLLGTDLLNQLDSRYSYVIDNQKNALIFRSKN